MDPQPDVGGAGGPAPAAAAAAAGAAPPPHPGALRRRQSSFGQGLSVSPDQAPLKSILRQNSGRLEGVNVPGGLSRNASQVSFSGDLLMAAAAAARRGSHSSPATSLVSSPRSRGSSFDAAQRRRQTFGDVVDLATDAFLRRGSSGRLRRHSSLRQGSSSASSLSDSELPDPSSLEPSVPVPIRRVQSEDNLRPYALDVNPEPLVQAPTPPTRPSSDPPLRGNASFVGASVMSIGDQNSSGIARSLAPGPSSARSPSLSGQTVPLGRSPESVGLTVPCGLTGGAGSREHTQADDSSASGIGGAAAAAARSPQADSLALSPSLAASPAAAAPAKVQEYAEGRKDAVVKNDKGEFMMLDVSKLFFDDCSTQGNVSNKYLGYKDMKYWDARQTFGLTTYAQYNSLQAPLRCIRAKGPLRKRLVALVDSPWFQRFIVLCIFLNAITLAMDAALYAKRQEGGVGWMEDLVQVSEYVFLALFTIEAVLKISAMGFCGHVDSYLVVGVREEHRLAWAPNWWNVIDFIIVLLAWAGLHPSAANFSVVRCLRLLRVLKALHSVRGLQVILKALLSSLGPLSNVVVLLLFFMMVFAVTGVLLWAGAWHQRCYLDTAAILVNGTADEAMTLWEAGAAAWVGAQYAVNGSLLPGAPDPWDPLPNWTAPALPSLDEAPRDLDGWVLRDYTLANATTTCTVFTFGDHCNARDTGTSYPSTCAVRDWRRGGYLTFDNTAAALLLLFKVISLDDWPDDMELATGAVGQAAFLYFLLVTLFGAFFTMNLVLAILCGDFAASSDEIREEKERERVNEQIKLYEYPVTVATMHFNYMRLAIALYAAGMPVLRAEDRARGAETVARMLFALTAIRDSQDRSREAQGAAATPGALVARRLAIGGGGGGGDPDDASSPRRKRKKKKCRMKKRTDAAAAAKRSGSRGGTTEKGETEEADAQQQEPRKSDGGSDGLASRLPTMPAGAFPPRKPPLVRATTADSGGFPFPARQETEPISHHTLGGGGVVADYAQHGAAYDSSASSFSSCLSPSSASGQLLHLPTQERRRRRRRRSHHTSAPSSVSFGAGGAWGKVVRLLERLHEGAARLEGGDDGGDEGDARQFPADVVVGVDAAPPHAHGGPLPILPGPHLACLISELRPPPPPPRVSQRRPPASPPPAHGRVRQWRDETMLPWRDETMLPWRDETMLPAAAWGGRAVVDGYSEHATRTLMPPQAAQSPTHGSSGGYGSPYDRPSLMATAPQPPPLALPDGSRRQAEPFGDGLHEVDDGLCASGDTEGDSDSTRQTSPPAPASPPRDYRFPASSQTESSPMSRRPPQKPPGEGNDSNDAAYMPPSDIQSTTDDDDDTADESSLPEEDQRWYHWRAGPARRLVRWKWFARFVVVVITFNVCVMCVDRHPISDREADLIEWTSFGCNIIFIVEMLLKILGLSVRGYFLESWNVFDFVLVMVSLPEMAAPFISNGGGGGSGGGVTALRALRALRVTRLLNRYKTLQSVVTTVGRSVSSAVYLCLIMLLFIFVFSVLGVQLFAGSFPESERNNFRGLWQSAVTVFVVITGEQWARAMTAAMEATSPAAFIYFVAVFSLGNYIFMNLFIAILIENFAHMHNLETEAKKQRKMEKQERAEARKAARQARAAQREAFLARVAAEKWQPEDPARPAAANNGATTHRDGRPRTSSFRSAGTGTDTPKGASAQEGGSRLKDRRATESQGDTELPFAKRGSSGTGSSRARANSVRKASSRPSIGSIKTLDLLQLPRPDSQRTARPRGMSEHLSLSLPLADRRKDSTRGCPTAKLAAEAPEPAKDAPPGARVDVRALHFFDFDNDVQPKAAELVLYQGDSLGLFSIDNPLRKALTAVVMHPACDYVVLFLIVASCAVLALDGPWVDRHPRLRRFIDVSEIVFAVLFALEALMKVVVYGFVGEDIRGRLNRRKAAEQAREGAPQQPPQTARARANSDAPLTARRRSGRTDGEGTVVSSADEGSADDGASEAPSELAEDDEEHAPYLWSPWNRVDFLVSITALLGLFVPFFAMFRALRSLRLIIRNRNIKVVVRALINALPAIGNVVAITLFVFVIFSILGVQLFKGKMYFCSDPAVYRRADCVGNFTYPYCSGLNETDCARGDLEFYCAWSDDERCVSVAGSLDVFGDPLTPDDNVTRVWENSRFNFDHLGHAFLSLFQVAFAERWADIMWLGVDADSHDVSVTHPRSRNHNPAASLFFVLFVVIGTFFCLNIFIGLLIDRFTVLRKALEGSILLLPEQQEWLQYQRTLGRIELTPIVKPVEGTIRAKVYALTTHPYFDPIICLCILGNALVMMTYHYRQSATMDDVQEWANFGFGVMFILEAAAKIYALRKVYFADTWNRFDFALVWLSVVGWLLGTAQLQVFRIFRIARMFRLIRKFKGLFLLFTTLFYSLPSLMNIGLLLLCVYFNFAVIGIQAYGRVDGGDFLSKYINFHHIGNAVVTLYTISTGEKWNDVMEGVSYNAPDCGAEGSCGAGRVGTVIYFLCFMMIGSLITLNLFITVVLENFSDQQNDFAVDSLMLFRDAWADLDPMAKGWLRLDDFLRVLKSQPPPIGLRNERSLHEMACHLRYLAIPVSPEGKLRFTDALRSISLKLFGVSESDLPKLKPFYEKAPKDRAFNVWHLYAAMRIQQRWCAHAERAAELFAQRQYELCAAFAAALAALLAAQVDAAARDAEAFGLMCEEEGSSKAGSPLRADADAALRGLQDPTHRRGSESYQTTVCAPYG